MFSLKFHAHSEVGRVRKNNQDSGYASPNFLLVADGMGGAAAGDLASAVAAKEAARNDVRSTDSEEMLERIAGIAARANRKISEIVEDNPEFDGMGTTFCGAMFNGEQFGLAHIGDSRGYLLRDGELTQLTHDHSWVQSLIDEGKITPEQAATHPHRSLILKVLNGQEAFDPDFEVLDAQVGDRLLFCSDGLSGLIDHDTMRELLQLPDLQEAVAELAQEAYDNGGHDNITVVVGEVVPQDDALDSAASLMVGSATEVTIPPLGGSSAQRNLDNDPPYPTPKGISPSSEDTEHDADEVARYAPTESKRPWRGLIIGLAALLVVVGGSAWALSAFSKSRYYVAADQGNVAIYNGLPGSFLGLQLGRLYERTDVEVKNLPAFYRTAVETTIASSSLEGARSTVTALEKLAEQCLSIRQQPPVARPTATVQISNAPGLPSTSTEPHVSPSPSASSESVLPTTLSTLSPAPVTPGECS